MINYDHGSTLFHRSNQNEKDNHHKMSMMDEFSLANSLERMTKELFKRKKVVGSEALRHGEYGYRTRVMDDRSMMQLKRSFPACNCWTARRSVFTGGFPLCLPILLPRLDQPRGISMQSTTYDLKWLFYLRCIGRYLRWSGRFHACVLQVIFIIIILLFCNGVAVGCITVRDRFSTQKENKQKSKKRGILAAATSTAICTFPLEMSLQEHFETHGGGSDRLSVRLQDACPGCNNSLWHESSSMF